MLTTFRILLRGALRDRISLFYGVVFPLAFLLVLGFIFPTPGYRQQLLAGMLAISTLFFSLNGIAFEALYQRNSGVYKLLRATPYRTTTFVINLTASRSVIALLSCALVALVGIPVFGVSVSWVGILLLLPLLVLSTLCFTLLGLTISNFVQNENQTSILTNIVTLPMVFSSETFYSLSAAPAWVRTIGHAFPLSYLLDGEHAALSANLSSTVLPLLVLFGFTLLTLALAVLTFRWDPASSVVRRAVRVKVG